MIAEKLLYSVLLMFPQPDMLVMFIPERGSGELVVWFEYLTRSLFWFYSVPESLFPQFLECIGSIQRIQGLICDGRLRKYHLSLLGGRN